MAIAACAVAVAVGSGLVIDQHALAASPPALTGSLALQAVRNTDPRAEQFLQDVRRGDHAWSSTPGIFVEGTIRWHLAHRIDAGACQLSVHTLQDAPYYLGTASTGTDGGVGMGDDAVLNKALGVTAPANSRPSSSYSIGPTATDGTLTFVVAYPDDRQTRFDGFAARASAVVECANHVDLFGQTRNVAGPVTDLVLAQTS
jgi:hypothetical protein